MASPRGLLLLRLGCLAAGAGLAVHACSTGREEGAAGERAYSVQLHVHGSFSEGMGSIDSHGHEARDVGVDVIWWSDHDFRITSYQHVHRFGFEHWTEPIDRGESWRSLLAREADDVKELVPAGPTSAAAARFVAAPAREGERSLRLRARTHEDGFSLAPFQLDAARKLFRRPLAAGVTLRLAVLPRSHGPDARVFVRVLLSEHAPRVGLGLEQYSLRYFLSNEETEPRREGAVFHVPVPYEPGEWNEIVLPLTADAERGFPFAPGDDDSLYRILLGVETRRGAEAIAFLDDLRIEHARPGDELFALQREVIDEVARHHPGLVQLQGVEISYAARHLNEFSVDTGLVDYDAIAADCPEDPDDPRFLDRAALRQRIIERSVRDAHARGGLVSYNHMFGTKLEGEEGRRTPEQLFRSMVRTRAHGADLLEVGYRDRAGGSLRDHLWVWDRLAEHGLRLVGIGVSDSHGGPEERWRGRPNNFVSWIHAGGTSKAALLEGLRAGRVFFGDIERFDGTLDLVTSRGWRMGQEVLTDRERAEVEVRLAGAGVMSEAVVVVDGEPVARRPLAGAEAAWTHVVELPPTADTSVRVEILDDAGEPVLFSNPIYFLRSAPAEGLRPAAAGIDRAGVRSLRVEGVRIVAVERNASGTVALRVDARDGELVLATIALGPLEAVRLVDLEGESSRSGSTLTLTGLTGRGSVELVPRTSGG